MRRIAVSILCLCGCGAGVAFAAQSFLTARSFPKTFDDLSFSQRMDVLTQGYEPFETVFDENGNCIQNCPYQGFNVQAQIQEIYQAEAESQKLYEQALEQEQNTGQSDGAQYNIDSSDNPSDSYIVPPQETAPGVYDIPDSGISNPPAGGGNNPPTQPNPPQDNIAGRQCSVFNSVNPLNNSTPHGEPLENCPVITSPYGMRNHPIQKVQKMHYGVDLRAAMGTNVFTVADGVVIKSETNPNADACGKYIKIQHPNGMITVYCHLSEILVINGQNVKSGCLIAKSGNTGQSSGPHLHYSVRTSENKAVDPERWLSCRHAHK